MTIPLEPDAAALAEQLTAMLPDGLSGLGVQKLREFGKTTDSLALPGPEVGKVENTAVVGPYGEIPVRIYTPRAQKPAGLFIYVHGGGWTFLSINGGTDHLCRRICDTTNMVVISVDYRMAPEFKFPTPIDEVAAVLEWVRTNSDVLQVDPAKIAIGGDSAGGNISAAITHLDKGHSVPLAAQALLYPATEYAINRPSWIENADAPVLTVRDTLWFWDQYLERAADRDDPRATPSNSASFEGLPPAIILVAGHDPLRDDGLHYAEQLRGADVPVTVLRIDGTFHGFMTNPGLQSFDRGATALTQFLNEILSAS